MQFEQFASSPLEDPGEEQLASAILGTGLDLAGTGLDLAFRTAVPMNWLKQQFFSPCMPDNHKYLHSSEGRVISLIVVMTNNIQFVGKCGLHPSDF